MVVKNAENFKYPKLRGRIVEKFTCNAYFADAMGVDRTVVSRKLSGDIGMSKEDMKKWASFLDIPLEQYGEYFFSD